VEWTRVSGWGRATASHSRIARPQDDADWHDQVARAGRRGVIARGGGCGYGDAAQNAGGVVALTVGDGRRFAVDGNTVTADAGVRLGDLVRAIAPMGWTLPVVPGAGRVTVGGAIAADAHGKNHLRCGTFGRYVRELTLLTPAHGPIVIGPGVDPHAFWATVGGLGLTGVILRAALDLMPLASWAMDSTDRITPDLESTLDRLRDAAEDHPYSVAWVDARRRGRRTGGGVVTAAGPSSRSTPAPRDFRSSDPPAVPPLPGRGIGAAPVAATANATRRLGARIRPRQRTTLTGVLFPLDTLPDWPALHGRNGLIQYQFVVPFGAEGVLAAALVDPLRIGRPPTLATLKIMGAAGRAPLSFPMPGWSLALDFPADPELGPVLDRLDRRVADAGGRVYLVKDSRLRPDVLEAMYPGLPAWRAERALLDPDQQMTSDLARRLHLTGRIGSVHG
jgi:decaprenylphospho-beta-D-ribofuranose 2-oxidase